MVQITEAESRMVTARGPGWGLEEVLVKRYKAPDK